MITSGHPSQSSDYLWSHLTQYWFPLDTPHKVVITSGYPQKVAITSGHPHKVVITSGHLLHRVITSGHPKKAVITTGLLTQ